MKINNKSFNPHNTMRGFTLIELLVVLALIAILTVVIIVAIKPTEIFKKSRDTQRIGDLKNIDKVFNVIYSTDPTFNELNYFSPNTVYLSLQDNSSTCGSYLSQLPSLPSGWSYHCSATPTNIDGSGWLTGLNFNNFPIINLAQLPIDPINQPPYYYSFVAGGSYKLTAKPEINYGPSINDGGFDPLLYEVGTDLKLSTFQSGLVGYLSFDEGTGTIAYDRSGFGNNGTLLDASSTNADGNTPPQWTTGKVGGALSFDGVDDWVGSLGNLPKVRGPWTTCAVFKSLDVNRWQVIAWNYYVTSTYGGLILYIGKNANTKLVYHKSGVTTGPVSSFSLTSNIFTFACATWDGNGNHTLAYTTGSYDNFKLEKKIDTAQPTASNGGFEIGAGVFTNTGQISDPFLGLIDEVRVYNRALSDSEIKALYEATK